MHNGFRKRGPASGRSYQHMDMLCGVHGHQHATLPGSAPPRGARSPRDGNKLYDVCRVVDRNRTGQHVSRSSVLCVFCALCTCQAAQAERGDEPPRAHARAPLIPRSAAVRTLSPEGIVRLPPQLAPCARSLLVCYACTDRTHARPFHRSLHARPVPHRA